MNTTPPAPVTPRVTDTPTLGARVTNRRGGALPGLAASLRVAELPNERNGRLVLVYDSEGSGRLLHPSPTHTGRWCLGSRAVAFAASDEATGATTGSSQAASDPQLWVRPDATGSPLWHRVEAVPGDDPDQTTACGLLVAQEDTGVYELTHTTPLPVCVGCYAAGPSGQAAPTGSSSDGPELHVGTEHSGLSGVWVLCSCGLSTSRQPARFAKAAWDVHAAHALAALRSAVQAAWDTRQVADTTPFPTVPEPPSAVRGDYPPVTTEQRDAVFALVSGASNVWRAHPVDGLFTAVELPGQPHPFYVRLFGSSSGTVGYTPRFGQHVELRLSPYQVACLQGLTTR